MTPVAWIEDYGMIEHGQCMMQCDNIASVSTAWIAASL